MKYLLMCEGPNEACILNMIIQNNLLTIDIEDILGSQAYHARNLKNQAVVREILRYHQQLTIYRIGDKQNDELKIPKNLEEYISHDRIFKYCTKPELEMLLIINEGLVNKFKKSKLSPKDYAKSNIKFNKKLYNNSTIFWSNYYEGRLDNLIDNIKEYKRIHNNKRKELYLSDLIKDV